MTVATAPSNPPVDRPELRGLARFGRGVARHHRWVALLWLVVLLGAGTLATADKGKISDDFRVPGTDSQAAYDLLQQRFASQNAATATVVLEAPAGTTFSDPAALAGGRAVVAALGGASGVASVSDPFAPSPAEALEGVAGQLPPAEAAAAEDLARSLPSPLSADGRVALVPVTFTDPVTELLTRYPPSADRAALEYRNPYSDLVRAAQAAPAAGVRTLVGGAVADTWNQPQSWWASHADEVGLVIGALLLLVAFGSLFGMAIPIATALFGAVTASGFVYLLASVIDVSSAAPPVTLMISLGVGLDYSLLIVTRYRQFLAEGHHPHDAAGAALGTAGKAALFAGITVCIALLGLWVVPIPLVQTLGLSAAIGVATMVLAALTLLPALLGFAGAKLDRFRIGRRHHASAGGPGAVEPAPEDTFWGRFAARMARRPWPTAIGGTVALLIVAFPFLHISFGMPADDSLPRDLSQQQAFVLTDREFGPGRNGPLVVAVGLPAPVPYAEALEQLAPVSDAVGALRPAGTVPGVASSLGPVPNSVDATTAVIYQLTPTSGPDSAETTRVVRDLRERLATATTGTDLSAHVGGATATLIDLTDLVTEYLPRVIGAVVLGAFVLLVLVFRSILVPLKAAAMNLVSIAAAYGVVVAVFQWGWARELVGLTTTIPIVSFVPLVMFVILFGLSMDYEVFLMSRIKEEWDRSGDASASVVRGVGGTARVITTAALIMIAVFTSFVATPNPTVKLIGFGMAVAVLLDATVVRMVLVPAVMELLGRRAWWFPSWLSWLPRLDVEGSVPAPPPAAPGAAAAPAAAPGPGAAAARSRVDAPTG